MPRPACPPTLLGAACALLCFACGTSKSLEKKIVDGNGLDTTELRETPVFQEVVVSLDAQVSIEFGASQAVEVAGDANLVEHVETVVTAGRLQVGARAIVRPRAPVRVTIRIPTLTAIRAGVGARVDVKLLAIEQLMLEGSGTAELRLRGGVDRLAAQLSGASRLHGRDLHALTVDVQVSGSAQAEVWAQDAVSGSAAGSAKLSIYGNPASLSVSTSDGATVEQIEKLR